MFLFIHLPTLARTILIAAITIVTLLGIMTRPFKLNEATCALGGAGLLLVLGLMSISALAEVAGFFDWLARLAGNSSRRLFLNIFLLGSLISMFLSNDATALILTPIVYTLVTRLRLPVLPFLLPVRSSPTRPRSCSP